jgi:hypothetical protein
VWVHGSKRFPFLYIVSQEMILHFYVFGFGMQNWVLCNTYGTCAITLKWDMGILLAKVTHGVCDPKELRPNSWLRQHTLPRYWIDQHSIVCGKTKTPKKNPRTGKSQKWTSYPTDTRQNPHMKIHEEPNKKTWGTKGRSRKCVANT